MRPRPKSTGALQDRRGFSRVHFRRELVLVANDGTNYPGEFSDISLKGMLFWSERLPLKGAFVSGSLPLGSDTLTLGGVVIASDPERGAAIRFQEMDVESFSHLRRLVSLNMGDSDTIDDEFFSSL